MALLESVSGEAVEVDVDDDDREEEPQHGGRGETRSPALVIGVLPTCPPNRPMPVAPPARPHPGRATVFSQQPMVPPAHVLAAVTPPNATLASEHRGDALSKLMLRARIAAGLCKSMEEVRQVREQRVGGGRSALGLRHSIKRRAPRFDHPAGHARCVCSGGHGLPEECVRPLDAVAMRGAS